MNQRRRTSHQAGPKASSKARSLHHPQKFVVALLFAALHFLTLFGVATCVVLFIQEPNQQTVELLIGSVAISIATWIVAYFKRKKPLCPLCKGTPLVESGALPHPRAFRIRPLNHGVSAVLSTLFTHQFRCMYCGSRYDLLRQPRDHRQHID